jgi:hypothetical protein
MRNRGDEKDRWKNEKKNDLKIQHRAHYKNTNKKLIKYTII